MNDISPPPVIDDKIKAKARKIAVANLSSLPYTTSPMPTGLDGKPYEHVDKIYVEMPYNQRVHENISTSLTILGLKKGENYDLSGLVEGAGNSTLKLNKSGAEKLVVAGVKNPVLEVIADRFPDRINTRSSSSHSR